MTEEMIDYLETFDHLEPAPFDEDCTILQLGFHQQIKLTFAARPQHQRNRSLPCQAWRQISGCCREWYSVHWQTAAHPEAESIIPVYLFQCVSTITIPKRVS